MNAMVLTSDYPVKRDTAKFFRQDVSMPSRSDRRFANTVVARNLRKIIDAQAEGSVNRWATSRRLAQGTVNRAVLGQSDVTTVMLEKFAHAAGYASWQLLLPGFEPGMAAPLMDAGAMRVAAVYSAIKDPRDRARLAAVVEQFAPDGIAPTPAEPAPKPHRAAPSAAPAKPLRQKAG